VRHPSSPKLFGTRVRYSGVSLGFQLGAMLGGFSPFISAALQVAQDGGWTYVAVYTVAVLLVSLLAVLLARETYREDLAAVAPAMRAAVLEPGVS
jgi:MHS family shikimate/dehydroshikimate transporter-like MFS transporter